MDRRKILKTGLQSGVVAVGATLAATQTVLADEDDAQIVGAWSGTTNSGPPLGTFKALYTFARGGGLVTSSSIDLSPHSVSTPGYGAWSRVDPRTFALTFDAFVFDAQGNPAGTVEARSTVTLTDAGDSFSGPFRFDVIAPNGAIVFSGSGTHQATRIRVKPL
jgi:hypothetical protein